MLKVLRNIIEEVNSVDSLPAALGIFVHRIRESMETQACAIWLVDKAKNEFVLMAAEGVGESAVGVLRIPIDRGLIGLVAERRIPVNVEDVAQHERYFPISGVGEEVYKAFLGVPILHRKRLLGVLMVEQEEARCYHEAEEAFLTTMSTQLANVLADAEIKHSVDNTESVFPEILRGIPSASGVGIGTLQVVYPAADLEAVPDKKIEDIEAEIILFDDGLRATYNEVRILGKRMAANLPEEERALFDAYLQMIESESLRSEVINEIRKSFSAQSALKHVVKEHSRQFRALENEYLRERATDIEDIGRRILANLQTNADESVEYADCVILIGNEVTATDLAEIPSEKLVAVVSGKGSSNSHVAILARALGVPSVMGVGDLPLQHLQGVESIVDGYLGQAYLSPDKRLLEEFQELASEEHQLDEDLEQLRDLPAETEDGHRVLLYVNTGLMADVGRSMTAGAEGVGLYRTEVPFMTRERFPSTQEQMVIYRQLLKVFSPRPVVMRVLDIGGDKPLPYFPVEEDNPFLGWRGIRLLLEHPDIFLSQLRAMLIASEGLDNLQIMLPLITDVSEVDESMRLIKNLHKELVEEGLDIKMPKVGIMIEVPSAVYEARALAKRVDFLSVGSNDLTQYILAVDRNNARVANLYDALHPAVLKALLTVVDGAHREGKTVSICGEMAGDPEAVILLLAMGFDMFSVNAPMLPRVKWVIRKFTMNRARKLLSEVLQMDSVVDIRRHLEFALEEVGLGGLIRAGKY